MGDNDGKEQLGEQTETPTAEELAKELGFDSVEAMRKKGKGLRKLEAEVNNARQAQLIAARAAAAAPTPPTPKADDGDDPLAGVSPKVINAIKKIVREEVEPEFSRLRQGTEAEMTATVADFLDAHPEVSQAELFEFMSTEEMWPSESEVTKPLLKRRLSQALRLMADPVDEKTIREKVRAEEAERQAKGEKVINVRPASGGEPSGEPAKKSNWVTRMNESLAED